MLNYISIIIKMNCMFSSLTTNHVVCMFLLTIFKYTVQYADQLANNYN